MYSAFSALIDRIVRGCCSGRRGGYDMDTAPGMSDKNTLRDGEFREADESYESCFTNPAITALRTFNQHFSSRALTRSEIRLFLASMAAFNRHSIGGIAILAGRLSDQILPLLPKR